jgi:hypothetical protein
MPILNGTDRADILRGGTTDDTIHGGGGNDVIYGGGGTNLLFGDEGDDTFVWERSGFGVDTIDGGAGRDTADFGAYDPASFLFTQPLTFTVGSLGEIRGVASFWDRGQGYYDVAIASITNVERVIVNRYADVRLSSYQRDIEIIGSSVADRITTGAGNDRIQGGGGNDVLDGGAGFDVAVYAGFRGAYGQISQTRVAGGPEGGFDTLANIEALQFLDGRLVFSATAPNGVWEEDGATVAIARMYDTVLDRLPDTPGLIHFRSAVDEGYDLRHFARVMVESPEFYARYGLLDNEGLVRQLYRAVLDREPDPVGLAEYTQALNNGLSRAELILILSESPEHRTLYQPVWDNQVRTSQTGLYPSAGPDDAHKFTLDAHSPVDAHASDWLF